LRQDGHVWADQAVIAATEAAARQGLATTGARPLRIGENAVVLLPSAGALARVMPHSDLLDHVRHELRVAEWLQSAGVPVTRPLLDEPVVVGDRVVSLWEYLDDAVPADLVTLAASLLRLHSVARPDGSLLSRVEPFARFEARLASAQALDSADRRFLLEFRDQLAARWQRTAFDLPEAVLHGDAHMENLLKTSSGRLAFVDLENVALGPPEWDLTLTALYYECGWFSAHQYAGFVKEYGFDVRSGRAWPVLREIRMLRMTTWLAQTAGEFPDRQAQLRHRIAGLRDGSAPQGWTGF
jgi:aminoglycoside phosphotransferase (APT) family kinase protein